MTQHTTRANSVSNQAHLRRELTGRRANSLRGPRNVIDIVRSSSVPQTTCILFFLAMHAGSLTAAEPNPRREFKQHELARQDAETDSNGSVTDGMSRREFKQYELARQDATGGSGGSIVDGMSRREFKQYELTRQDAETDSNGSATDGMSRREFKQYELGELMPLLTIPMDDVTVSTNLGDFGEEEALAGISFDMGTAFEVDEFVTRSGNLISSRVTTAAVPEPSSVALLCISGLAVFGLRRQR